MDGTGKYIELWWQERERELEKERERERDREYGRARQDRGAFSGTNWSSVTRLGDF